MKSDQPGAVVRRLLKQVLVPHVIQVIILGFWAYIVIDLVIDEPWILFWGPIAYLFLDRIIHDELKRRAGQKTSAEESKEILEAPSKKASYKLIWDKTRTYQVWHLIFLAVGTVIVAFERFDFINLP